MDFNLSREHQLIRKMMAEFTEKEVKPIAAETDRTCEYPRENIEKLFNLGVMGMCVPKEYGGAGADPLASAICIEELSKQCASTGDIVATHNGLCCDPIMTYGTAEQKAKYLPMLTKGHHVGAFALTEPNAGSDASKGQTEAKLEGDHYVMNGSKIFITNGYVADVFVVFAMTDKSKGTKGISAFIVESSFPGFSVGKHEEKMGLHGSPTAEIVFTDMIVPKENMLGREGKGFNIAMQTLDGGRIGIAAQSLGIAEGALEEAKAYTKGRVQFGKPISKFQNTQIIHAIEAHHGDVEPKTPLAFIIQAADAISAARPGARRENVESYVKRLENLEEISSSFEGVEQAFAVQAGREVRILVKPDVISDDQVILLARAIAKKIEDTLDYPGQIKVNVIRESRAVEYAK